MQDEQENNPLAENIDLAELIRSNMNHQNNMSLQKTLFKESLVKLSLDKDLEHLFQIQPYETKVEVQEKPKLVEVTQQTQQICDWLQKGEHFSGMAHLPFGSTPRLLYLLQQKTENLVIVVTDYLSYWVKQMQYIERLAKLKWACLSASQNQEQKVKVLGLYQLRKLKLLFIPPSLFQHQEYLSFECDLLILNDLHIYQHHNQFLEKIIEKCSPGRVLGLYHTLLTDQYKKEISPQMASINKPRSDKHNFIVLKTTLEDKFKQLLTYLSKNEFKKTLIIVSKRQEADLLNKKMKMESKTSENMYDILINGEISHFASNQLIRRIDKDQEEERVLTALKQVASCEIVISGYSDFLRLAHFDLVVFYSFTDVLRFVEYSSNVSDRLLLMADEDYYDTRNEITSELISNDNLQRIVIKMIQRVIKRDENVKKRFYSDCVEDMIYDGYTVSKDFASKIEEKSVKIHHFCRKNDISSSKVRRIMESLQKNGVININSQTICEIEVACESLSILRLRLPYMEEFRRKVNILNVSTKLQQTTRCLLDQIRSQGIKFKISEEAIQFRILKDYEDIDWSAVCDSVNSPITAQAVALDKSFKIYKECAYGSIQLTKRERVLERKKQILNFLNYTPQLDLSCAQNISDNVHRSNLLNSEIEKWVRGSEEVDEHDLVLLLQGVEKGKVQRFKDDPIYGRYRKWRYDELIQAVHKIYANKKLKIE